MDNDLLVYWYLVFCVKYLFLGKLEIKFKNTHHICVTVLTLRLCISLTSLERYVFIVYLQKQTSIIMYLLAVIFYFLKFFLSPSINLQGSQNYYFCL